MYRYQYKNILRKVLLYTILIGLGTLFIIPLLWMLSASLKEPSQVFTYPIEFIPAPFVPENYIEVFRAVPFLRFIINSFIITILALIGDLFTSSLVGYSFARLRFPGRSFLFILCLSTVLVPVTALIIPQFILFEALNTIDTYIPIILPSWFAYPFWVFLMRQYYMSIPLELDDAARIDGCNYFSIYWKILLPLAKPALATVGIFSFIGNWNKFLQPLIYLNTQSKFPVSLGLSLFQGLYETNWELLMAGATIAMLPCMIIFFLGQKYFVRGIHLGGGK